jgi:GNAT superfamily N-acetyltransferase
MEIRPYCIADAPAVATISATCAHSESDFALNPLWETRDEFEMEFDRFGIDPATHLLVADAGDGEVLGFAGVLCHPNADSAGLICPVVIRGGRRRGVGGELLRAVQELATDKLGIRIATAGIGTRNRGGYSLLASHGFRPVRQHFFMRCDARPKKVGARAAEIEFAAADASDAEAIHAIYRYCGFAQRSAAEMEAALSGARRTHAVARIDGRTIAFVEIETHWPRRVWVAYVGVNEDNRDRGVGSALVAWALAGLFDAGTESAMLLLSPANRSALRAYEKVGFRRSRLIDVLEKTL